MFTQQKVLILLIILAGVIILGVTFYTLSNRSKVTVNKVANDFAFRYEWGACHADWGRNDLKVDRNGNAELELSAGFFKENKKYLFMAEEIAEIYSTFESNNFFELDNEYRNTGIIDGGCSAMALTANGKNHRVSMVNKSPNQIEKITTKILRLLDSKDSKWKEIDKQGMCNKAKIACVVTKDYNGIPCDAWSFSCKEIMPSSSQELCEIGREYENNAVNPVNCRCPQEYKFETVSTGWGPCPNSEMRDCSSSILKCVPKGFMKEDLERGWYWGNKDQNKFGTPENWIYREAGRSSCWHKPEVNCDGPY